MIKLKTRLYKSLFFLYFGVANGEPPIGIPWETFQKFAKKAYSFMK